MRHNPSYNFILMPYVICGPEPSQTFLSATLTHCIALLAKKQPYIFSIRLVNRVYSDGIKQWAIVQSQL